VHQRRRGERRVQLRIGTAESERERAAEGVDREADERRDADHAVAAVVGRVLAAVLLVVLVTIVAEHDLGEEDREHADQHEAPELPRVVVLRELRQQMEERDAEEEPARRRDDRVQHPLPEPEPQRQHPRPEREHEDRGAEGEGGGEHGPRDWTRAVGAAQPASIATSRSVSEGGVTPWHRPSAARACPCCCVSIWRRAGSRQRPRARRCVQPRPRGSRA
jgi:hypothetical protein